MGGICSADHYVQVKQKYGTELSKYVVGQKMKLFINQTTDHLQAKINEKSIIIQTQSLRNIKQKSDQIEANFIKVKQQLIASKCLSAQQCQHTKIQNALGYTYFQSRLKELRQLIYTRFKSQQRSMKEQLHQIRQTQEELINEERPHMIIFNQMKPEEQKSILKRGAEEYMHKIKAHEDSLMKKYGERLTESYYLSRFQKILNMESLGNLAAVAKDKFKTSAYLIMQKNTNDSGMKL